MGLWVPAPGYLEGCAGSPRSKRRRLESSTSDQRVSLCVFGGAQALFGVTPDLTCLGKIVGGGLPRGRSAAAANIMEKLAPLGRSIRPGRCRESDRMAAGLTAIGILGRPGHLRAARRAGQQLGDGLAPAAAAAKVPVQVNRLGSMVTLFFTATPVTDYRDREDLGHREVRCVLFGDAAKPVCFCRFPQYEAMFVSLAHTTTSRQVIASAGRRSRRIDAEKAHVLLGPGRRFVAVCRPGP